MKLTKTIERSDYNNFSAECNQLREAQQSLEGFGAKIDIGHEHRYWEYGMGKLALFMWMVNRISYEAIASAPVRLDICDVGAGDGLLLPAIASDIFALNDDISLTEVEPRRECRENRDKVNSWLDSNGKLNINWVNATLGEMEDAGARQNFDVVFCISVIEHIKNDVWFLSALTNLVKPNGLLFLTTDVVPEKGKAYTFDNLRAHNYDIHDVGEKLSWLLQNGFKQFGDVDLEYKGDMVFDYSFASICVTKCA